MANTFFTSDTHYAHKNICRATSNWDDLSQTRDFNSLDMMNDFIVDGINSKVGKDDVLFHLGDWSFGGKDKIEEFRNRINCKNVHLIYGNHDENIVKHYVNKGLFISSQEYLEIKIHNTKFAMFHFPIQSWNNSNKGTIHLHGHVHGEYFGNEPKNRLDVGMDSYFKYFGKYEPFSYFEIMQILKERNEQN